MQFDLEDRQYDLVIVGGGFVGASLALALKNHSIKIALIDKAVPTPTKESILNARAIALSATSQRFFEAIQLWPVFSNEIEPIHEVQVSKKGSFGITRLNAAQEGLKELGFVISADKLTDVLNQALISHPNLTLYRPDEIKQLKSLQSGWQIELKSGTNLSTALLIAADGSHSFIRQHQGIGLDTHDYEQTAVLTNIRLSCSHRNIAYERFTKDGPIAMLPFSKNLVKLVWVASIDEAKLLMELDKPIFLKQCQSIFGYSLGEFIDCGTRISYPLQSAYAESLYSDRLVLIGNAANTLHPVGAQGLNLGLRDVAALSELLATAFTSKQDLGSLELLQKYAEWRKADHEHTRFFIHQLVKKDKIYTLGILGCEVFSPLKNWVIQRGMGMLRGLPKLSRGLPLT